MKICLKCKNNKKKSKRTYRIQSREKFKVLCTDIFGPFELENYEHDEVSEKGFFLTVTDVYSRFTKVKFLTSITNDELIKEFQLWIKTYGIPRKIICDNGKQYTSKKFKDFLEKQRIKRICTPMYHPASNGISERLNQTLAEVLHMYRYEHIDVISELIMKRLNNNYHRGLGAAPKLIVDGYSYYDLDKTKIHYIPEKLDVKNEDFKIDENNPKKGELIYIRNFNKNKLEDRFIGPYVVQDVSEKEKWYRIGEREEWIHVDDVKLIDRR